MAPNRALSRMSAAVVPSSHGSGPSKRDRFAARWVIRPEAPTWHESRFPAATVGKSLTPTTYGNWLSTSESCSTRLALSSSSAPAVAQRELNVRLRDRRKALGLTTKAVSGALGFTPNYWSAVENDRTVLAEDRISAVVSLFEFSPTEADELMILHSSAKAPRWWTEFAALLDDDLTQFIGLEDGASRVRNHEGKLIAGLLQTEEYASAVIGADPVVSAVTIRQRWELRQRRQRRLTGSDPLHLTSLVSEAALMQHFGSERVLRDQLVFLAHLIDQLVETLVVRVLPFDRSPLGMTGASTLNFLDFRSPHLPTIAWREAVTPIGFTEDPEEVETLQISYTEALDSSSLSREDSLRLIERRIAELG